MIDKNDVKMPVQKRDTSIVSSDKEQVQKIEELLRLVNQAEKKQELRLKGDYYSKFNWFGDTSKNDKSYFSYQEEAVYDFVFNLNKSGILSDQVGMGKTIEAGMIISELASRNELRSLLIIVPNEIMAQKWEYELESKFGIKELPGALDENGEEKKYPAVKAIKSYNDFCKCVFDCVAEEKFFEIHGHDFSQRHRDRTDVTGMSQADAIKKFVSEDIKIAVDLVNEGFERWDDQFPGKPRLKFDGKYFSITGTSFKVEYKYDYNANGEGAIASVVKGMGGQIKAERAVKNHAFIRRYKKIIEQELYGLYVALGDFFTRIPSEISNIAQGLTGSYPILVIPIAYSKYDNEKVSLEPFLNRPLLPKMENYKHKYIVQTSDNEVKVEYEEYRIIDFFIDVGYQTLIVDEVHDYIDVCSKMERGAFHLTDGYKTFPSSEYNRYELFDDYYFIKKGSLYKKLKGLADKANRKIFLTATPIKSDMVDFYLLTLLASNKDSEAYKKISEALSVGASGEFTYMEEIEDAVNEIYDSFQDIVGDAAEYFCRYSRTFLAEEKRDSDTYDASSKAVRYVYPYFNNQYLRANTNKKEEVEKYLLSHMGYLSVEEIVMNLILAYNAEKKETNDISTTLKRIRALLSTDMGEFQTRVVFRTLLNNTIKLRFEEDFTNSDGKPIKRIRELLECEDGPRRWHKTYRKYGIRHTRHQTYNLSECEDIDKLNKNKMERYKNLPVWPRRDGKVIFLTRDDVFFDCFLNVRRDFNLSKNVEVKLQDLPNVDKMVGEEEEKLEKFENAKKIFEYINGAMSGGSADTHEPQSSNYESVELDDSLMTDYKLALVNKLMRGDEPNLGAINKKVLLFAENDREKIVEWFKYQEAKPLLADDEVLDPKKVKEYEIKRKQYGAASIGEEWLVSENTNDLNTCGDSNLLVIIDPKRYEKGVDLQKADTIINFDINYCPLKMEQRIGRIDRIRPNGQSQEISIVSFVPLNDMSGFVINFFANELKMFTQWMGETTGIVSVPEEEIKNKGGEDVSFEGKVYSLERFYKHIYTLCKEDVSEQDQAKMVKEFESTFKTNSYMAKIDFKFLNALRPAFNEAFCSSISPQRKGFAVRGERDKRVMRFNAAISIFEDCGAESCDKCSQKHICDDKDKTNRSSNFVSAVNKFFDTGIKFYAEERIRFQREQGEVFINSGDENGNKIVLSEWLEKREASFVRAKQAIQGALKAISATNDKPFTVSLSTFNEVFNAMKTLYWDDTVSRYMSTILNRFYKQCDSVLQSAGLFEKFIKTLSIADFMNNMEGNV